MTRAVYLLGAPGIGKTTLMARLKADYVAAPAIRAWPKSLLWLTPLYRDASPIGYELGRQRDRFGGTDALGMSVHPEALAYVEQAQLPDLLLGEGARLGTERFLSALARRADLTVVHLIADDATLAARRAARVNTQDPRWMRGAATRAANAADRLRPRVRVVDLDASPDPDTLREVLSAQTAQG